MLGVGSARTLPILNKCLQLNHVSLYGMVVGASNLRLSASSLPIINCVSVKPPVPSMLVKLRSDLEPFLNREDLNWRIIGLVIKYVNVKPAIQNGCLTATR